MKINVVMVEPEIPQNTGNIARTCAAIGAKLHLVYPLGFEINDKHLKRAGLDYWDKLEIEEHDSLKSFLEKYKPEEKSVFLDEKLDKIKIPTKFISNIKYKVIRKDIDLNKHMHNLYYLDLAYEALPEDVYAKRPFDNVRITYKKEIKLRRHIEL